MNVPFTFSNKQPLSPILEFKRTSDQRHDYRERGEARARAQHKVPVKSLQKVAGESVGENSGWKIKLVVFVGGTCGSVHMQTLNNNLKELGVIKSKRKRALLRLRLPTQLPHQNRPGIQPHCRTRPQRVCHVLRVERVTSASVCPFSALVSSTRCVVYGQ